MKIKLSDKILIILFFCSLLLPSIVYFFVSPNIKKENMDNRKLADFPVFNSLTMSQFPEKFDEYYADNLPFRNQQIYLYSYILYKLTGCLKSSNVIIGRDKWLFYNNVKSGNPVADYKRINQFTLKELIKIRDNLNYLKEYCEKRNCSFILLICPSKENIYTEYMPKSIIRTNNISRTQQLIKYLRENTDIKIVYPYSELIEAKKDNFIYYKNDTHWNLLGAYIASKLLLENFDIELPNYSSLSIKSSNEKTSCDLANMYIVKEQFKEPYDVNITGYTKLNIERKESKDIPKNLKNFPGGTFEIRDYCKNTHKKEKIMMARDSFGIAMIPVISCNYENSVYVHRDRFKKERIDNEKPDVFVLEIVERYLPSLASKKYNFKTEK